MRKKALKLTMPETLLQMLKRYLKQQKLSRVVSFILSIGDIVPVLYSFPLFLKNRFMLKGYETSLTTFNLI